MMAVSHAASPASGPDLRDIHIPSPPPWWPPAPGWWMVAVLIVVAGTVLLWWWRRRHQRHRAEQAILAELDSLAIREQARPQALATGLHQLLRRVALQMDANAARQHGKDWRQTLASMPVDARTVETLVQLETVMYRPAAPFDSEAAVEAARRWLICAWRRHLRTRKAPVASSAPAATESGHA